MNCHNRWQCLTHKAHTPLGACYIHVDYDGAGVVHAVRFSQPQKFEDTSVGVMLEVLQHDIGKLLDRIRAGDGDPVAGP